MSLYPFDPSGELASNLIPNEEHIVNTVNGVDLNYIVPRNTPFFNKNMVVFDLDTGEFLDKGTDWDFGWDFEAGLDEVGESLSGSIYFIDPNYTGRVKLMYQTLGGDFVTAATQALTNGLETLTNLTTAKWDNITPESLPTEWPTTPHTQPVTDIESVTEIINAINRVADILVTAPPYIRVADIIDLDEEYYSKMIAATDDIAAAIREGVDFTNRVEKYELSALPDAKVIENPGTNIWVDTGLVGSITDDGTYKVDFMSNMVLEGDQGYDMRYVLSSDAGATYREIPEGYRSGWPVGLVKDWVIKLQFRVHGNVTRATLASATPGDQRFTGIVLTRVGV